MQAAIGRRGVLLGLGAALTGMGAPAFAAAESPLGNSQRLFERANRELGRLGNRISHRDVVGICDFSAASRTPRFHLLDMRSGRASSLLVAHGKGSDPGHRGWVERLSNVVGSEASSDGAYRTGDYYVGKHGRSMRLRGLDATNSNAEPRAIVVHAASYVSQGMVRTHGKLGRSQGCFAFSDGDLDEVLTRLGPGRLLIAAKV